MTRNRSTLQHELLQGLRNPYLQSVVVNRDMKLEAILDIGYCHKHSHAVFIVTNADGERKTQCQDCFEEQLVLDLGLKEM